MAKRKNTVEATPDKSLAARVIEAICETYNGGREIPFAILESANVNAEDIRGLSAIVSKDARRMLSEYADRTNPKGKSGKEWMNLLMLASKNGRKPVIAHATANLDGTTQRVIFAIGKVEKKSVEERNPGMKVLRVASPRLFDAIIKGKVDGINVVEVAMYMTL